MHTNFLKNDTYRVKWRLGGEKETGLLIIGGRKQQSLSNKLITVQSRPPKKLYFAADISSMYFASQKIEW